MQISKDQEYQRPIDHEHQTQSVSHDITRTATTSKRKTTSDFKKSHMATREDHKSVKEKPKLDPLWLITTSP